MLGFIFIIIKIIFLMGFLITIHELGHFVVAKLCKVKVNEFSIGFGPVILKKKGNETAYKLRLIPLGGFVSMEGETGASDEKGSFSKVSIFKRIAIVSAGGLVNIVFAIALYFGIQATTADNYTTKVSYVKPGYAAEQVGILPGDSIVRVNGKKVRRPSDVRNIVGSGSNAVDIVVNRSGTEISYTVVPTAYTYKDTGIYFRMNNDTTIQGFDKKNSIINQGLKAGDKIISVNGENVEDEPDKVGALLENCEDIEIINFKVRRHGKVLSFDIKPVDKTLYLLGISYEKADKNLLNNVYYAGLSSGDFAFSIVDNVKMIIKGETSADDMTGPIGISTIVAKTDNLSNFLYIMAVVSLSLGFTNLLPFPPLDGGKNVLLIIEAIRRKPIPENVEVGIQMFGFFVMIVLSIFITYNDILKI